MKATVLVERRHDVEKERGRQSAPGSFVRSMTAIAFTVDGSAEMNAFTENGLNSLTFRTPTRSPW